MLITFKATDRFYHTLRAAARDKNVSISYLIRRAIAHYLDDPSLAETPTTWRLDHAPDTEPDSSSSIPQFPPTSPPATIDD